MGTHEDESRHCVYRFYDAAGILLYVGRSCRFGSRMSDHRKGKDWWHEVANIGVIHCPDHEAADDLERRLIKSLEPLYNVQHAVKREGRHLELAPPTERVVYTEARSGEAEPWLDREGLARHLCCGPDWIRKQMLRGMPYSKIGNRDRFKASAVDRWLAEREEATGAKNLP